MLYRGTGTGMGYTKLPANTNWHGRHKPPWCMEEERDGEAKQPGPPRPGTGPKHTLTFSKKRRTQMEEEASTNDGETDDSELEVFQDDDDAEYDPGPHAPWSTSNIPSGTVLFESANCTSFKAHLDHIVVRENHAAVYQEAKVP